VSDLATSDCPLDKLKIPLSTLLHFFCYNDSFDSPPALEKIAVSISNSVWREGRGCENNALPVTETPAALAFVAKQQKMAGEFYSFLESFDLEDHFDSLWDYGVKSTSAVSYLKESDRVKLNLKKFQFAYLQDSARRI